MVVKIIGFEVAKRIKSVKFVQWLTFLMIICCIKLRSFSISPRILYAGSLCNNEVMIMKATSIGMN